MDSIDRARLVCGTGLCAVAPLAGLVCPGPVGTVATGVLQGIGANLLHTVTDNAAISRMANFNSGAIFENGDLRRLVGETIRTTLLTIEEPGLSERMPLLSQNTVDAWNEFEVPCAIQKGITELFCMPADRFARATALTEEIWIDFLQDVEARIEARTRQEIMQQRLLRNVTDPATVPLSPEAIAKVARVLFEKLPHNIFEKAKEAWEKHDRAYAALELCILRELATEVQAALRAVRESGSEVLKALGTSEQHACEELERLHDGLSAGLDQVTALKGTLESQGKEVSSILDEVNTLLGEITNVSRTVRSIEEMLAHSLERGIYVWTPEDQPPQETVRGGVLFGGRVMPSLLKRGYFMRRARLQDALFAHVVEWIDAIENPEEPICSLPVFWVEGPSGVGKSVALLYLAADLKRAGHIILWLDRSARLLEKAIERALSLQTPAPSGCRIVIMIDDAFVPGTDPSIWERTCDCVNDLLASNRYQDLPLVICSGSFGHRQRFKREFEDSQRVDITVHLVESVDSRERDEFLSWLGANQGLPALQMKGSHYGEELPVFLVWQFACSKESPFDKYLVTLLDRHLGVNGDAEFKAIFARLLTLNRLYVDFPAALYTNMQLPIRAKLTALLDDFHLTQVGSGDNSTGGLRLVHARIANMLYKRWVEHSNPAIDDLEQGQHLADAVLACVNLDDIRQRVAPLEGLSRGLAYRRTVLGLTDPVVRAFLDSAWPVWKDLYETAVIKNPGGDLIAWIQIFSAIRAIVTPENGHPILLACDYLLRFKTWEPAFAEMTSAFGTALDSVEDCHRKTIVTTVCEHIDAIHADLSRELTGCVEWCQRWRLGQELENTLTSLADRAPAFQSLGRKWLLVYGHDEVAAALWERGYCIGLAKASREEMERLAKKLDEWLGSHYSSDRWAQVWSHGATRRQSFPEESVDLDAHFFTWAERQLTLIDDNAFPSSYATICRWARDRNRKWRLGPKGSAALRQYGVNWLSTPRPVAPSVEVLMATLWVSKNEAPQALMKEAETLHTLCLTLLSRTEVNAAHAGLWKHVWFHMTGLSERLRSESLEEDFLKGWNRIKDDAQLQDWTYIAQHLFRSWDSRSGQQKSLWIQASKWLLNNQEHPGWNYVNRHILQHMDELASDKKECGRLLGVGASWLDAHPYSPGWNYVWKDIMEHRDILRDSEARSMVNRAIAWLGAGLGEERNGWIVIHEEVLKLYNDSIRTNSHERNTSIRFELPPWFVEEGVRYIRNCPSHEGNAGVVAQLLRCGAPSDELLDIGLWIKNHLLARDASEDAWIVAQNLAQRPDDLPDNVTYEDVLNWLLSWLRQKLRDVRTWRRNYRATRTLALRQGTTDALHRIFDVCLHGLEAVADARHESILTSIVVDDALAHWQELQDSQRGLIDTILRGIWENRNALMANEEWPRVWLTLARRLPFGGSDLGWSATDLERQALAWLSRYSYRNGSDELPRMTKQAILLDETLGVCFLQSALLSCNTISDVAERAHLWRRIVDCVHLLVDAPTLKQVMKAGDEFLRPEHRFCGSTAFGMWQGLWLCRERIGRSESDLLRLALGLIGRSNPSHWYRDWQRYVEELQENSPDTPAWTLAELALEWRDARHRGWDSIVAMIAECHEVLVPEDKCGVFLEVVKAEFVALGGAPITARLVIHASGWYAHVHPERGPDGLEKELQLDLFSALVPPQQEPPPQADNPGDPRYGHKWWRTMKVAASFAHSEDRKTRLQERILAEKAERMGDPGAWVDIWIELASYKDRYVPILGEEVVEKLIGEGKECVLRSRYSPSWPRTFQTLIEFHGGCLRPGDREALYEIGLKRLKAMTPDDVGWPLVWFGLDLLRPNEDFLFQLGRHKLLAGPKRTRGLGRVLLRLCEVNLSDAALHDAARRYLWEVDSRRFTYEKVRQLVEQIDRSTAKGATALG